tara:strand:+ start:28935 stop:29318 length:384 start_codon:yes stop_codon:yes gene_type:complete
MKLGDYLTAINYSKETLLDTEDDMVEKEYKPFIINRCLSYFPDTIMQVNEMNFWCGVDKKMHFDFLLNSIRKRKRFSKWLKDIKPEDFETVKKYFNYSDKKTKEVMALLTENDIDNIKKDLYKGGKK